MTTSGMQRRVFCNRTLNLRAIRAIGYDMDYTLIHYNVAEWERRAYVHLQQKLIERGWPVGELTFQPEQVIRGLVLDVELGNVVKPNRFGYVKRAMHGTRPLDLRAQRLAYAEEVVDLGESRFVFLNTLFSLSEACMYMQLVDLLDEDQLPGVLGYRDLYTRVRQSLDEAHMEGELKAEILGNPERYIVLDPDAAQALLDQRLSGKQLMLITNSEWYYTREVMAYAYDRFLPGEMTWRDLFDLIIVSARKPYFFLEDRPLFRVVDEDGLLRPQIGVPESGGVFLGGNATQVESYLQLAGSEILYVGDHIYVDVKISKRMLRWRSALILRELETELEAVASFAPMQRALTGLMQRKSVLEQRMSQTRLAKQRGEPVGDNTLSKLRQEVLALDEQITPHAKAAGKLHNPHWGLLLRTGNDKSHLARQLERHADIYTSRVSNFMQLTPFAFLRSPRGSLPHDPGMTISAPPSISGEG